MGILRIMAVGRSGVGKSTIGNMLLEGSAEGTFETSTSSSSCTQVARHRLSSKGDCEYTDVPGIPDTNPSKTAEFYDIIIQEAKRHQTVILFVFKRDRIDAAAYKLAEMLFREVNKSNAAKILVINDHNNYAFKAQPTEADYKDQLDKISSYTKIKFTHSIVVTANTMQKQLEGLKQMLSRMPDYPSEHLKTFTELKEYVDELREQKNYQEELLRQGKERIAELKDQMSSLEQSQTAAVTATAIAAVCAFFTFGTSLAVGATTAVGAAAAAAAIQIKQAELEEAEKGISPENLKEAARKLQEACENFEELQNALKVR